MGTCDGARARAAASAGVHAAAILLLCAAAIAGCARAVARPPATAPGASSHAAGSARSASQSPQALDPSEEITPEELSSIPDPSPAGSAAGPSAGVPGSEGGAGRTPAAGRSSATGRQEAAPGDSEQPAFLWRVQVFAAQDLDLADRKAKEAAERLHVKAHLEFEAPYYKVRLGDYGSEEEAQSLREKAIQAGYPGAFRVRCASDATQDSD